MEACELLAIESRLDRIEAELAIELPHHVRAFARAHAAGTAVPPAPDVVYRGATLATARAALAHPVLADRGLALLRLAAPSAIECAPAVTAVRRAALTWEALSALASARDAQAQSLYGSGAIALMHLLHGSALAGAALAALDGAGGAERVHSEPAAGGTALAGAAGDGNAAAPPGARSAGCDRDAAEAPPGARSVGVDGEARPAGGDRDTPPVPPPIAGWFDADGDALDDRAIARRWDELRARHGGAGQIDLVRGHAVRPRAFIVVPGREVIVVVPARVAAPADRFAVLHELGHAIAALAAPAGIPRVVDEAVAAYVARAIEHAGDAWYCPLAEAARQRRRALAERLDRIERALPGLPAPPWISARPPWALWHDPGAQAAYAAAEAIADAIVRVVDTAPGPGALANALAAACAAIDHQASARLAG